MDRSPRTAAIVVLALLLAAVALVAGCSQQQPLSVKLTDHPTYGTILTDSTGRSLYIIARDVPNTGAVANLGDVSRFYPPFYAQSVVGGNGINISEFGHITRADGKEQTTYRGWPLYYYINDRDPGDAKSQGANNITFLAKPDYTVMVRDNTTLGVYLTDPAGAALLVLENATGSAPASGYLPFRAFPVVGPSPLVQAADFGQEQVTSGQAQTTFKGQPLYVSGDRSLPAAAPRPPDGYHLVVLARGDTLTGSVELPTAAPSPSQTVAAAGTVTTTAPATTTEATAAETARTRDDIYTGGQYTPTPYKTVDVVSQSTESATPAAIWTPIGTAVTTGPPVTPAANVTALPTKSAVPTTLSPATTRTVATTRPTAQKTTAAPTVKTTTARPTTIPTTTLTTRQTTVPVPITTLPTTKPTTTKPTTLPLPFPISTQGGNGS